MDSRERFLPCVIAEASESATLFRFVADGVGLTIYPSIVEDLNLPGVVVRPFVEEAPVVETYAVVRRHETNPTVNRFVELIRDVARSRRSGHVATSRPMRAFRMLQE